MSTISDACRDDGDSTLLAVRVTPGADRDGPDGVRLVPPARGGAPAAHVVWRVRARAVDGRANAALVRSVADHLGVRAADVEIVRGARGRAKVLRVRAMAPAAVAAAVG